MKSVEVYLSSADIVALETCGMLVIQKLANRTVDEEVEIVIKLSNRDC